MKHNTQIRIREKIGTPPGIEIATAHFPLNYLKRYYDIKSTILVSDVRFQPRSTSCKRS